MSKTNCERCNGLGLPAYKSICGGVCFACGALPAGETASPAFVASARERIIGRLAGMVASFRDGRLDVRGEDKAETLAVIRVAPADVAARAMKAFGLAA